LGMQATQPIFSEMKYNFMILEYCTEKYVLANVGE
jgi:hypothetical protein